MEAKVNKLKPCPFCGKELGKRANQRVWNSEMFYEHPVVKGCYLSRMLFPESMWNVRPIEDTLNDRIRELEHTIDLLKDVKINNEILDRLATLKNDAQERDES